MIYIYIGGTRYRFTEDSFNISDRINERSTANFTVVDPANIYALQKGQLVEVYDSNDGAYDLIFSGFIDSVDTAIRGPIPTHNVRCTDMHYLAEKRVCAKTYTNQTAGYCVKDIAKSYLAAEGIYIDSPNAVFDRNSTAYNNNGTISNNDTPRFTTNGIIVETGTTNLFTENQAAATTNTVGWNAVGLSSFTRDTDAQYRVYGTAAFKMVTLNAGEYEYVYSNSVSATAGLAYTFGTTLCGSGTVILVIDYRDAGNGQTGIITSDVITLTATPTRYSLSLTAPANTVGATLQVKSSVMQDATIYFSGSQFEQKAYATSWQLPGSARVGEVLTVPTTNVLSPTVGTVEMLVNVTTGLKSVSGNKYLLSTTTNAASEYNRIAINHGNDGRWYFKTSDAAGASTYVNLVDTVPVGLHRISARWSENDASLWIDGINVAHNPNPKLPSALAENVYIGSWVSGTMQCDAQISDVVFSNIARPDEELAARGVLTPLGPDGYTTFHCTFDDTINGTCYIGDGITLSEATFNWVSVAKSIKTLAERSSYWWCISAPRVLYFNDRSSVINTTWGVVEQSDTIGNSIKVKNENKEYRNRQIVKGSVDVTSLITESFACDSKQKAWAVGYNVNSMYRITVGRPFGVLNAITDKIYADATWTPPAQFTVMCRCYVSGTLDALPSNAILVDCGANNFQLKRNGANNSFSWEVGGGTPSTGGTLSASTRMTVMGTYNGTQGQLIVNGVKYTAQTNAAPSAGAQVMTIGHLISGDTQTWYGGMYGGIYDVAIWNRVLTDAEIESVNTYGPEALTNFFGNKGMVAWYCFDQVSSNERSGGGGPNMSTTSITWNTPSAGPASGMPVNFGTKGSGGSRFYYSKGDPVIAQDANFLPLAAASFINFEYYGEYPIVAITMDGTEVSAMQQKEGVGTGIVDHVVTDVSFNGATAAIDFGNNLLKTHGYIGNEVSFNTRFGGLYSGEQVLVNMPDYGINNINMLVYSVTTTIGSGRVLRAVSLSDNFTTLTPAKFFQALSDGGSNVIREGLSANEVLVLPQDLSADTSTWTDAIENANATIPVCNTTTLVNTNVYPG